MYSKLTHFSPFEQKVSSMQKGVSNHHHRPFVTFRWQRGLMMLMPALQQAILTRGIPNKKPNTFRFNLLTSLLLLSSILMVNSIQAQQYWRIDGINANWTGSNWSNTGAAPFTTAWSLGSNAVFNANSTVTFLTTTVGNITVADGATVTVSPGGTLTTTAARTFNIGTGSTLTWQAQNWSTSASSAGFIKSGAGTWDIGAQGNALNATNFGFTLNAGTVIVSGNNSFGGTNSILTLNGGTIQSSGTRTYANNITLGGNHAHTGTGNATFSGTVGLGATSRTITNSTTSGNRIFSGVISGASGSGLTFDGISTGMTELTGANTYTGLTTVTGGTLRLNRTGGTTIPTGNSITVNSGGTLRISTTQTLNNVTVDAGGTLIVDAALTITGTAAINGTFQINGGGFASGGTWTYSSGATLVYNHTASTYGPIDGTHGYWPSSNGPTNVTVQGATGQINLGVSRAVSGTFQTLAGVTLSSGAVLTCNGTCQINAGGFFNQSPTYGSSSTLIYNVGVSYGVTTEWAGNGTIAGLGIPQNVTIQNSTTVSMPNSNRGMAGNLNISSGTLTLNASSGDLYVAGNWTNAGTFTPNNRAVFFNGTGNQTITKSGGETFAYLTVNKTSGTLVLANNVTVNGSNGGVVLQLTLGNVNTGANTLILGSNANYAAALSRTSGHVIGNLQRAIATGANTYDFPVGTLEGYTPLSLAFTSVGTGGNLTVNSDDANHPNFATYGLSATKYVSRHWNVTNSGVASFNASGTFTYLSGDLQGGAVEANIKAAKYDAPNWTLPTTTTGTNSFTAAALTSFSSFMGGEAVPDYTLSTTGNVIVLTDASGNGETLTVSESGANINFNVTGRTYSLNGGSATAFPVNVPLAGVTSITLNTAAGNDIINIGTFITTLPSLAVNGGTGDDAVNLNGDLPFAANANLDLDLQNDDAAPGTDAVTVASIADIALSGTGTATVKVSKSFTLNGGTFSTTNGNLIVEANQQATPTGGTFNGVDINAGQLQCFGTGNVTVKGKGGDSGINQRGVYVRGTAGILSSHSGILTVIGTGGASSGNTNSGVEVSGSTAQITSFGGGNVSVTGQGGGSGASSLNVGVYVQSTGNISAGGSGALTIQGTGGAGSGGGNYGVYISNGSISTSNGNVSVTGTGAGTGASFSDYGIFAQSSSSISAGGSGSLTVQGTGGASSGGGSYGLYLANSTTFSSAGGNVQVTGQGGGTGSGGSNGGITLNSSCVITAGGLGTVTVQGTGGNTSGSVNGGVSIANTSSITSSGGSVSVTGTGGGTGTSGFNFGVELNNMCLIKAGGSGTVTVVGNGANSSGNQNGGVVVSNGGSQITSTGGNVQVTGTAGGTGGTQVGVWVTGTGQISAGGSGTVTVTGNGGNGSGSQNYGVFVNNTSSQINSSGGQVSITGQEGTGGVGINTASSGIITTATNGGNITLIANSMNIGAAVSTNGSSSVTMRPYTNGVQINLGSATDPIGGPLSLSDTELDLVTTGTLNIGNANSGTITVSAASTRPASTNMNLVSNGDVTLSGGGINTGGGTLFLDPGTSPAAVKPTFTGTDATASTLSFGSDLAIVINGTTPGTQYNQLTVVGAVNLTGVDLVLSGSHIPVAAQTFTIVDNDGADAITGTFTGLAQGATIANFLGSGLNAQITSQPVAISGY